MDDNLAQQAVDKGYVSSVEEYKNAETQGRQQAGVVSASDIGATAPVVVPPAPASTSGQIIDQITLETQNESNRLQKETDTTKKTFEDRLKEVVDVMGSRDKLEEQQGLGEARLDVADIRSQIESRELALRRAVENTQKTAGLSGTQISRRVGALNRDAARELADLSIIESARLRRFDAIETNIDRKIKSQLEPLQFQLQYDQMFYQENRQALTASQDRAFQLRIAAGERQYQEEVQKQNDVKNIALQAAQYGATGEQVKAITDANDFAGAMELGSTFLGEPFRLQVEAHKSQLATDNLQRQNILSQMAERRANIEALKIQAQQDANQELINKISAYETKSTVVDTSLDVLNRLKENQNGLKAATGSTFLGRLPFGTLQGKELVRDGKSIGTLPGGVGARFGDKANFLTDVEFIINNLTFDKLSELKATGATFGALSDSELRKIGDAASVLSSMANVNQKTGKITGLTGTEEKAQAQIDLIISKMEKERNTMGADFLSPSEMLQIINSPAY